MSRIGKKNISLPEKVEVIQGSNGQVTVKGPKGSIDCTISPNIKFESKDGELIFTVAGSCNPNNPQVAADYGTSRALVNNCVLGVSEGWKKQLELHGVGYNAKLAGKDLTLNVGYSHPVVFTVPEGVDCKIEKNTNIYLESIDKQKLGNFAAKVRKSCPPEPYLGKGIRYSDEYVRRKAGKAAAK